jgi:hypothetical protein
MSFDDLDDFFASDEVPEPPPEIAAPVQEPPKKNGYKSTPNAVFDAGLPSNVDAEKTVLGAALLDNACIKEILQELEPDDFSLDSNRRICHRMADLYNSGHAVDIVTLVAELEKHKERDSVGGVAYLASLTEGLPRRPVIDEYLRILVDKSILRKIMLINSASIARAADQSETALEVFGALELQLQVIKDRTKALLRRRNPEPFFVGYRTFASTHPDEIEWTVEGIIQKDGNGLILGDSGTSKSLLIFDLALHLVGGVQWFHHKVPSRVKVGLVAREDSPGLSHSRLTRMRAGASESLATFLEYVDLEDWLYVHTRAQRETWSLQKEADIQEIIEATKERGIQFLFFDVFRTLWEGNENDNQETARVLESAKRIGREANCQVCIVHHLSKSDRGTIFDRARGGGINGWKEWGIGLTVENPDASPKDQIRKMVFHTKASVSSDPIHYRIDGYDSKLCLEEVDPPTQQYSYKKGKKKEEPVQDHISWNKD